MLVFIKLLHTAIWVGFNVCFVMAVWSGLAGRFDVWFWVPVALIAAECVMLYFNDWICPLTPIAARYTDDRHDAFDIYLPRWVARHNKAIYSTACVIAALAIAITRLAADG